MEPEMIHALFIGGPKDGDTEVVPSLRYLETATPMPVPEEHSAFDVDIRRETYEQMNLGPVQRGMEVYIYKVQGMTNAAVMNELITTYFNPEGAIVERRDRNA